MHFSLNSPYSAAMNDRFLEDLKDRLDIREVVAKYTPLKKSGKNWMGKSPFRSERTPSFSVSPDRNLWYDFGASEGGDMIRFIEKIENVSFHEAVEILAQIAGVEVPKNFGQDKQTTEKKNDIFALHKKATAFFVDQFKQHKAAQKYLLERGFRNDIIDEWQLGYGGQEKNGLTKFLLQNGFSQRQIAESGVAFERDFGDKSMRDRFVERVMIPICEPKNGEIIAFSGRWIGRNDNKKVAKYINSPENPVYHKSSTLFGLDKARQRIRGNDRVILVEGNFDVISAHGAGFSETVATCGTSLTEEHLRILKRFTKNIVLAFDNDVAGKKATLRSVEMILKAQLSPFIIEIVGAKDFDELLQKDPESLKKSAQNPVPALEFFLDKFIAKYSQKGIEGQKKTLDSFFYFLRLVDRPIEVDYFLDELAKRLKRAKPLIVEEYKKFQLKKVNYNKPKFIKETKLKKLTREESLVGFMSLFWDQFSDEQKQQVQSLLQESVPRDIFLKRLENLLTEEERVALGAWEMDQGKMYDESVGQEIVHTHLEKFLNQLKKEQAKVARRKAAEDFK